MSAQGRVSPEQRFTRSHPCPICGGHDGSPRGKSVRCTGYMMEDGTAAVCTRIAEGSIKTIRTAAGEGYVHRLKHVDQAVSRPGRSGEGGRVIPAKASAHLHTPPAAGLTLARYAEAKGLPLGFLRGLGLTDISYQGQPVVRIVYRTPDGSEAAVRFRLALDGEDRFRWRTGSKLCLYGLERLATARKAGYLVLDEGESDAHTLWLNDFPALGLPGASSWQEAWAEHLEDIPKIFVIIEPDDGGESVLKWLATSRIRNRVRLVRLDSYKDPSALFLADPAGFPEAFRKALAAAVPWREHEKLTLEARRRESWTKCEILARVPDILVRFVEELVRRGVAGESRAAKLVYLAITSRLLDKIVALGIKGPSSAGKSFLAEKVLGFFPPEAFYALSAMSERALAYGEEPLAHRILVIYEAAGLQGDFASYLVRSLLSEGRIRYETVEKTPKGLKPRIIEREGPTGLIVTTTRLSLHPENETRLLSIPVSDTTEQTRAVLLAIAEEQGVVGGLEDWHALQVWIAAGDCRVTVPYARSLAGLVDAGAVRLRRDFGALLALVKAHALLHQVTRERDGQGRIVASLGDYAAVRELVADIIAAGVEAGVPGTVRETVGVIQELAGDAGVTVRAAAERLGLDRSAASRRLAAAERLGYLSNLEDRKGRPARYAPGDPLPADRQILPSPEALSGVCRCADGTGGEDAPSPHPEDFEERAAIMEIEGGLSREDAEGQAARLTCQGVSRV